MTTPVVIALPFRGRWLVQNSPARRVPSHGTDLMGGSYAIDFVGVDDRHRTAARRDWRTLVATEPPERFVGYGRVIVAPADGVVVATHDGELDHAARRSPVTLLPYALTQGARLQAGIAGLAGNHVIVALRHADAFVALAHLRAASVGVEPGQDVRAGQPLGECGNSGNSTQPHVHVQIMDGPDPTVARGLPVAFRRFSEWRRPGDDPVDRDIAVPSEGAVVEPWPDAEGAD
jgi:murein DD-endopeptidase MepM/ murein hydrolase activator NlpD